MRLVRVASCLLLAACLIAARPDTFTRQDLEALEAEKRAAEAQLERLRRAGDAAVRDLRGLENDLLSAAVDARRREEQAASAEKALIDLRARRESARGQLLSSEAAFEDLLAALAAINRRRPPALVVTPDKANVSIRRAVLMQAALPQLNARADAIGSEIERLNRLERQMIAEQAQLEAAEAALALKREEIEQLAALKRLQAEGVSGEMAGLRARAQRLGQEAGTLRDLLASLEAAAPPAPSSKPPAPRPQRVAATPVPPERAARPAVQASPAPPLGQASPGRLLLPVAGRVTKRFGERLPGGSNAEFIAYETRAEAQVSAPIAGSVEYARPFRSYGHMLILRTSDGYRVILTGMNRIYVSEGQGVAAGEPVGRMPDRTDPLPELTLELRLGDRILDPADWMERSN
jgi:septal ring factor EnvC (AmiA/AmiB activator)